MTGMSSGVVPVLDFVGVGLTLLLLLLFGVWWNRKVASWGKDAEGYTWLQVVIGTLVTILGAGALDLFVDWNAFFTDLLAFTASGIPMIRGEIERYTAARKRLNGLQKEFSDDTA